MITNWQEKLNLFIKNEYNTSARYDYLEELEYASNFEELVDIVKRLHPKIANKWEAKEYIDSII